MFNGFSQTPHVFNEPIWDYAPGTPEKELLQATLKEMLSKVVEVPQYIGNEEIFSGNKKAITPPFKHQHVVGYFHEGTQEDVKKAIDTALAAREKWATTPWEHRAAIFLKAADLLAGPYRAKINAATMLNQSKNAYQAEIDAVCELIDFLRFNVEFMTQMYAEQPISSDNIWNRMEYRPLEGFLFAVTPFNFTAIAGNLPTCMAMLGNVVVWKPSDKQVYSANVLMQVMKEAGLPDGVINMILTDPIETSETVLNHPDFSGLHFTGSTFVFKELWKKIGENIHQYKTYPRIVGETGGKDFVWAHPSANVEHLGTGLIRGAFEYQGQKCSAASRAYVPKSLWNNLKTFLEKEMATISVGTPEDFGNFVNAVIDKNAFHKITGYIDRAKKSSDAEVIIGGVYDDSEGYFIHPTVVLAKKSDYESMVEEIFGPVLTIYLYEDDEWESSLDLVDETSEYALTGAIFAQDRYVLDFAMKKLVNAAGNFYLNDKPTGAVVGQQPFGGARGSGTNDKAGSLLNLYRWVSARSVKEALLPPSDYRYPFLG